MPTDLLERGFPCHLALHAHQQHPLVSDPSQVQSLSLLLDTTHATRVWPAHPAPASSIMLPCAPSPPTSPRGAPAAQPSPDAGAPPRPAQHHRVKVSPVLRVANRLCAVPPPSAQQHRVVLTAPLGHLQAPIPAYRSLCTGTRSLSEGTKPQSPKLACLQPLQHPVSS